MRFKDKVVWITGASSGIGEGLAVAWAKEGAKLALSARRVDQLNRVKALCVGAQDVLIAPFDMVDEVGRARAVETVLKHFGHVDIMVHNAGVSQRALAKDTALHVDRAIMELDYFSAIALTKLLLPAMLARKQGHFVVTSSVAGKFGTPLRSAYSAAKHALHGYFDTLMVECAADNIAVSLLVVAGVKTDVSLHALKGDGTTWGKMDATQSAGLGVDECARIVLDGVAKRKHEINVLEGPSRWFIPLRQYLPGVFYRMLTKRVMARSAARVGTGGGR